jgi:hypothetical protein
MRRLAAPTLVLLCFTAASAGAQGHAMHEAMAADAHMRMTPGRPAQPGDAERADSILAVARVAAGKYRDVALAEQDGYRRFAADVPHQRIYHYNKLTAVVKARFAFDPAAPSSLLYQDDGTGGMTLVGVMYTAPADATLEQLNSRIPLSVARWDLHRNICLPPADQGRDSLATPGARFGFRGTIATRAACEAAGGRFRAEMFGWMVHLNLFQPGDPWQDHHPGMRPS